MNKITLKLSKDIPILDGNYAVTSMSGNNLKGFDVIDLVIQNKEAVVSLSNLRVSGDLSYTRRVSIKNNNKELYFR